MLCDEIAIIKFMNNFVWNIFVNEISLLDNKPYKKFKSSTILQFLVLRIKNVHGKLSHSAFLTFWIYSNYSANFVLVIFLNESSTNGDKSCMEFNSSTF